MDKLPVATDQMPLKGFTVTDKLLVTRFVHGSVHKTRRDGLRRGRRTKLDANGRRPSAEVSTPTRDGPETPETYVVVLITQRSQVQILPPLLGKTLPGDISRGRFSCRW